MKDQPTSQRSLLSRLSHVVTRHYGKLLLVLALLLVANWLWQRWQGPQVSGYRLEWRPLVQTVVATGRVVTPSRIQVGSEITGVVVERRVREGDRVEPGDILAVLKADQYAARVREARAALAQLEQSTRPQAQAALQRAQAQWQQASRSVQRQQELLRKGSTSREALEQAEEAETVARAAMEQARLEAEALAPGSPGELLLKEQLAAAEANLEQTLIRSRVAGMVLTRNAEPGDLVQPGQVLFDIARDGDTEILVPLDEEHLNVLQLGQLARCVADAYPARPFAATLSFIAPRVDPQLGTVEVRLTVDPVPDFLRQDMTVSVNLETGRRESALVLPDDALIRTGPQQAEVWMVREGRVQRQTVQLGLEGLSRTEILAGLEEGDWVLADPTASLTEGDRVRVREQPLPSAVGSSSSPGRNPFNLN